MRIINPEKNILRDKRDVFRKNITNISKRSFFVIMRDRYNKIEHFVLCIKKVLCIICEICTWDMYSTYIFTNLSTAIKKTENKIK